MNLALITDVPLSFLHNGRLRISRQCQPVFNCNKASFWLSGWDYCSLLSTVLFMCSIMMKKKELEGKALFKKDKDVTIKQGTMSKISIFEELT